MQKVTMWFRRNSNGEMQYSHYESDWNDSNLPANPDKKRSYSTGYWKKVFAYRSGTKLVPMHTLATEENHG